MTKTITVNLDDIKVDITLDKIIDKEVEKRVKKEVEKAKEEFNKQLPVIQTYGRREGNSYRAILYAQLLASGRPDQNVFVLCHNKNTARDMLRRTADFIASINFILKVSNSERVIYLLNNSRIFFTTSSSFYDGSVSRGLNNLRIIHDDQN